MIVCIVAGGSGTRLWPISTSDYPKHLIRVNGDDKSLLQNTYERARKLSDDVYIITEAGHAQHIRTQITDLPEKNFIVEPDRRGTASCTVAALAHIANRHKLDEPVALISADHLVRDVIGFTHSLKIAAEASLEQKRIVMVGIEPDYPSTGFGYIKKSRVFDESALLYEVDSFKEKPDYDTALNYVKSGQYLWNCSYLVGSVETILKRMKRFAPHLVDGYNKLLAAKNDKEYKEIYLGFENNSIDYALLDFVDDLMVVPASFDWMDLGSFGDLHKAVGGDQDGNYTRGDVEIEGVENSYIDNKGSVPMAVIGLDNVVVINTEDGILVARKDLGQKVGEIAKRIASRGQK